MSFTATKAIHSCESAKPALSKFLLILRTVQSVLWRAEVRVRQLLVVDDDLLHHDCWIYRDDLQRVSPGGFRLSAGSARLFCTSAMLAGAGLSETMVT